MQCAIDGCERSSEARGMCNKHYQRWRKDPKSDAVVAARAARPRECLVDGCDRRLYAFGWCPMHYTRWRKHGDPLIVKPKARPVLPPQPCNVEGCARRRTTRGWCDTHYSRWQRHGDPLFLVKRPPRGPCSVDGCDRLHGAKGYCKMHYQRWRVHGDPTITLRSHSRPARHGTMLVYTRGCRCDECVAGFRAFQHRRYARWRAQGLPPGDHRHGRLIGYNKYGCRCQPCCDARRQYVRPPRKRRAQLQTA